MCTTLCLKASQDIISFPFPQLQKYGSFSSFDIDKFGFLYWKPLHVNPLEKHTDLDEMIYF